MQTATHALRTPDTDTSLRAAIIRGRANSLYHHKGHTESILDAVKDSVTKRLLPFLGDPDSERIARNILRAIIAE